MPLTIERDKTDLLITESESGLLISGIWTVDIPKTKCIEYVNTYNKNMESGFVEVNIGEPRVVFSHESAKLNLSEGEAAKIIKFIQANYME